MGGALYIPEGCPGSGTLPWVRRVGPVALFCLAPGAGAWEPNTNPTAQAPASWSSALLGAAKELGGGGGASCVSKRGFRGLALPVRQPPVLGACGRGPLPSSFGRGGYGRGGPLPTPYRNPFGADDVRCGDGRRAPGERGARASVWGVRGTALSLASLSVLWAGGRGPLSVFLGRVGCGRGGPSQTPERNALGSWCCAMWARQQGARGGGALVPP